jgi:hypothetical protein
MVSKFFTLKAPPTLDKAEHTAHVGAGWEKRVDGRNQGTFVGKDTLMRLNLIDSPCCQGSNASNVTGRPTVIFAHA